jgi:hypothetical protein
MIEKSVVMSYQLAPWFFFHHMTSPNHASAHNDPPSVATSLLCGSLLSTSDLTMRSKCSSLAWREDPLCQILPSFDQESSILPYQLAASCNCWFFIAKVYQVVPCLITLWSLIVLPSLKPIPDFIHWIPLSFVLCGSSHGTPSCHLSFWLPHVSHFIGETAHAYPWSPCLLLDPVPFALHDYSQLEETSSRASFLMTSS